MTKRIAVFLALVLATGVAHADEKKAEKKKAAKKSEKNPFDKAAGDVEAWAKRTFTRKEEKKK